MDSTPNDLNSTTTQYDKYEVARKGWSAMAVNTICLVGISGYIVYAYVVIKNRSSLTNPFYTLTLSMMVSDVISLLTELMFSVPVILLGGEQELSDPYRVVVGFFANGAWFWCSSHLTFMAANRVVAVCLYHRYLQMFNRKKVNILILSSVIYGFVLTGMMYICTCQYHFKTYAWNFDCQPNSCAGPAKIINQIVSNGAVLVVIVCMVVVVVAVRRSARKVKMDNRSLDRQQKREIQLVFQFVVIGVVLAMQGAFFWAFPWLMESKYLSTYVSLNVLNVSVVLMSSVHPFLYLFFGSEVREKLFTKKNAVEMSGSDGNRVTAVRKQKGFQNGDDAVELN